MTDKEHLRKTKFACVYPEYIVSEQIKKSIEEQGFTGISFSDCVRDWKGRKMEPFYLATIHCLPPLSNATWIYTDTDDKLFSRCGHVAVSFRSELMYEKEKIENFQDFNIVREYDTFYAFHIHELVVSARVRQFFKEHKMFVVYDPIKFLDDKHPAPPKPPAQLLFG